MAELRLDIDANGVVRGVAQFDTATDKIKADAAAAAVAVGGLTKAFNLLRGAMLLLAPLFAALAVFKLGRGLLDLAKASVQTSASFELLGARLEVLTGGAENAASAMAKIRTLAAETPFEIQGLTDAAAQIAVVFRDDIDAVEEFTGIVANLAAFSGKDVEVIAQNVQRSLSGTLASAELLRDAGIAQLLKDVSGETDAAALSGKKLEDAYRALAGEGTSLGESAKRMSKTVDGALGNIKDAADNVRDAFGDTLGPIVRAFAEDVAIPALESLEKTIRKNRVAISEYAEAWAVGLGGAIVETLKALARVSDFFDIFAVNMTNFSNSMTVLGQTLNLPLQIVQAGLNGIALALVAVLEKVAVGIVELLELGQELPDAIRPDWIDDVVRSTSNWRDKIGEVKKELSTGFVESVKEIGDAVKGLGTSIVDFWTEFSAGRGEEGSDIRAWADTASAALEAMVEKITALQAKLAAEGAGSGVAVPKEAKDSWTDLDDQVQTIADDIESSLTSAFTSAINQLIEGAASAEDVIRGLMISIAEAIVQATLIKPAAAAISAGITSAFSGPATPAEAHDGASFRVAGLGGTDSQMVSFMATPGESVDVMTPTQQRDKGIRGGSGSQTVNIINLPGQSASQERRKEGSEEVVDVYILDTVERDMRQGDGRTRKAQQEESGRQWLGQVV